MNVARFKALISQVESSVEFDLGAIWKRLDRDEAAGGPVLSIWWAWGCRRLTVRFYLGSTTIGVSALVARRHRKGVEYLIAGDLNFLGVLRRGVDWLHSEASPQEFDPRREVAPIVPDFTEEP